MFSEAAYNIESMLLQLSKGGLSYFAIKDGNKLEHKMEHLACFAGGLYGLAATEVKSENSDRWMDVAK